MAKASLYFMALVPGEELRERVRLLKEEMKQRYNVKHALKSPAHVTLQMPFKRSEAEEATICRELEDFATQQQPFRVLLTGFDHFSTRVIFLKVEPPEPVADLHGRLASLLEQRLGFGRQELSQRFHPHMTIATRDLNASKFAQAWPTFTGREFTDSFTADSLCLLKHNGHHWEIYRWFGFGEVED